MIAPRRNHSVNVFLQMKRDARPKPQESSFRLAVNSPSRQHLTLRSLLFLIWYYYSTNIKKVNRYFEKTQRKTLKTVKIGYFSHLRGILYTILTHVKSFCYAFYVIAVSERKVYFRFYGKRTSWKPAWLHTFERGVRYWYRKRVEISLYGWAVRGWRISACLPLFPRGAWCSGAYGGVFSWARKSEKSRKALLRT